MFLRLLWLFTIVPVVELFILIKVGKHLGTMNTIVIIIVTGVLGAYLAKSQGLITLSKIRQQLAGGQMPGKELGHGILILIGGVMLITPGFITDIVGLSLVLPLTRFFWMKLVTRYFKIKFQFSVPQQNYDMDVIDVESEELD